MCAQKTNRRPFAGNRVNPHERNEIKYWCNKFGCSEMELKNAVMAVGTAEDRVRGFLAGKKTGRETIPSKGTENRKP
ncbi:MAG: DUF3606 domain-containing protein [Syntrophobacteraceae bacterium]